jgi:hypothetical protein
MPLIILRTINSKKWNVFRRKASKKAFGGFQSATEFKWSAGPRRTDEWPGAGWLTYLFCSCRARWQGLQ